MVQNIPALLLPVQVRDAAAVQRKAAVSDIFYYVTYFHFSSQSGDLFIVTATPKIEMTISDTTDYKTLDVSFKVHSLLPLKKMTTTLESQPIEFQKEKGVYHAVLTNNGTLEVYVLSLNGMQAQDIEHIAVLDDTPPSFDEESVSNRKRYTYHNNRRQYLRH